jgi:hypothetical protein
LAWQPGRRSAVARPLACSSDHDGGQLKAGLVYLKADLRSRAVKDARVSSRKGSLDGRERRCRMGDGARERTLARYDLFQPEVAGKGA